jgi:hypothetical protein
MLANIKIDAGDHENKTNGRITTNVVIGSILIFTIALRRF